MRTYLDQNRILHETDRRFHAADLEMAGGYVQIVPAVVERLAPRVIVGAWGITESILREAENAFEARGQWESRRSVQAERWWMRQWRRREGLYRVRELSRAEEAIAQRLLSRDGMPPECFPRAEGALHEDNDARVIAQVLAVGGTLLITSNMAMVVEELLQEWFDRHHNQWPGMEPRRVVQQADVWLRRCWEHPAGPRVLTRSVLGAFWPETGADTERVLERAEKGLNAMAKGHFPTFAAEVLERLESKPGEIAEDAAAVRRSLPVRMRKAEEERRALFGGGQEQTVEGHGEQRGQDSLGRYQW